MKPLPSRSPPSFSPSYGRGSPIRLSKREGTPSLQALPEDVAVLDEHDLTDEHGKFIARLSPARLQVICDHNNKRIEDTGDYVPIVIGHTKDDTPGHPVHEKDQPEVIGFAGPFSVKKLFKTGKKAIFAKWKIYKDKLDLLRKYPRRSVELWVSKWEIDPISVLGATTPDRDLGLVKLARPTTGKKSITCLMRNHTVDPSEIAQQVVALIQQTSTWKFLESLEQEAGQMGDGTENPGGPGPGDPQEPDVAGDMNGQEEPVQAEESPDSEYEGEEPPMAPEEEEPLQRSRVEGKPTKDNIKSFSGGQKGDAQHVYRKAASCTDKPMKKEAGVMPGGNNTFVPSYGTGKPKTRMSRSADESDRIRLARVERQVQETATENHGLRVKLARAERTQDLIQLEAEGYVIDRDEELDRLAEMPEDIYQNTLGLIRKRYQRFAGQSQPSIRSANTSSDRPEISRQRAKKAVDIAAAKGIKFEEALQMAEGEQVF